MAATSNYRHRWTNSLDVKMSDGNMPNTYDEYDFETVPDTTTGVCTYGA